MNEDVKMLEDGIISCCSWCFPGSSIFEKYPELKGRTISHGMCKTHKAAFYRELASIQHLNRPAK